MFQKITLIGYLGSDPEMRYTPNGDAVVNFSLATSKRRKGKDGEVKENTAWFRVSVWGNFAETVNQYLSKGSLIYLEGELISDDNGNPRTFTTKAGQPGASFEVVASVIKFIKTGNQQSTHDEYMNGDMPF